ncbi:RNA 2',3'-cyclic phosphodiesterase ['Paenibacillus yunnanensis' Narsing Rao et al. 2020]|uniref:RNA 2',3'-cyclic phosphodiesterase n=1 Tax=Paenibacillus tengchongensis TaxID=2608684 RepID=UPI001651DB55|nr:RNA 2',3'-cyclic phosphodiesterase [Paenibacillus tengchongensis]
MEYKGNVQRTERLFIAVKLPEPLSEQLEKAGAEASSKAKFAKWTHFQDYHITLQFLGDTPAERIPALREALRQAASGQRPFTLKLDRWGIFGAENRPRVLWAGVSGELDQLRTLQQSVVAATKTLGFAEEARAYNPHITLARKYRDGRPFNLNILAESGSAGNKMENIRSEKDWTVDGFMLYATKMHAIPMYVPIEKMAFL